MEIKATKDVKLYYLALKNYAGDILNKYTGTVDEIVIELEKLPFPQNEIWINAFKAKVKEGYE